MHNGTHATDSVARDTVKIAILSELEEKSKDKVKKKSFSKFMRKRGLGRKLGCFYMVLRFSQTKFYLIGSYVVLFLYLLNVSASFVVQQATDTSFNSRDWRLILCCVISGLSGWVPLILVGTGLPVLQEMKLSRTLIFDCLIWFLNFGFLVGLAIPGDLLETSYIKTFLGAAALLTALRLNTHNATMSGLHRVFITVGDFENPYTVDAQVVWQVLRKALISPSAKASMEQSLERTKMDINGKISPRQYSALLAIFRDTLNWNEKVEKRRRSYDKALKMAYADDPSMSIGPNMSENLQLQGAVSVRTEKNDREALLADLAYLVHSQEGGKTKNGVSLVATFSKAMYLLVRGEKMKAFISVLCMFLFACCTPTQAYLAGEMAAMCNTRRVATIDKKDEDKDTFYTYFGVIIGLYFFSDVMSYTYLYLWGKMGGNSVRRIQMEMIQKVCIGDTTFGDKFRPGKLGSRFSSSLAGIFTLWTNGAQFIALPPILLMVAFGFMSTVSVPYLIFSFGAIPFVFSLDFLTMRSLSSSRKNVAASGAIFGAFQNAVDMRDALRTCDGSTEYLLENLSPIADESGTAWKESFHWTLYLQNTFNSVAWGYQCLSTCTFIVALWNEVISLNQFVAIQGYVAAATVPMFQVGIGARFITSAAGDVTAIVEILNCPDIEERQKGEDLKIDNNQGCCVTLENISFRYTPEGPLILKGITQTIAAGSYVVLCGGSGSGKSTLLSILMRFRAAAGGRVCINGQDISKTSLESFRQSSAVVFQTTLILDGSIAENIAFGLEGDNIRERVEQAARDAEIYDTIVATPDGFETQIGKRSTVNLSGGQLQRICIARALARKPKLLLLDEATSALDPITEASIIKTLERLREASKGQLTIISVSHHPLTALNADNIIVLSNGAVAETGTFKSLVDAKGHFAKLVDSGEPG